MTRTVQTDLPAEDPVLELCGDLDGLPADLSANVDRSLEETYATELPAPNAGQRRRYRR